MKPRGRLSWSLSSVRLRILTGLAVLLVVGLTGSAVTSTLLLKNYLHARYTNTLRDSAARMEQVIEKGPQTALADQLGSLLGAPMGIVAVDAHNHVLLSTGSAAAAPQTLARITASVPPGRVVSNEGSGPHGHNLSAIRLPSPGLTIDRGPAEDVVRPAALVLTIDTSIDDTTTNKLIGRQLAIVAASLVALLGLAVIVLRVGMRPLARMARSADAIAQGSLAERLPTRSDGSETDQLAEAVNRAFDAQARAEATVRSLAADTSHELRTPLSTISGWLDLHRQGGLTGPSLDTALGHIENEVGRMRLLVEDLALLARLDAGRAVAQDDVDLNALAASVVEDAQVIHPDRGITLTARPPAPVTGDAPRLQQVLRNLVGNAVQHTPAHTAVRVEITTTNDRVELQVVDNGPGIPPQDLTRVFERFWRAEASRSRAYGGSGLGPVLEGADVRGWPFGGMPGGHPDGEVVCDPVDAGLDADFVFAA